MENKKLKEFPTSIASRFMDLGLIPVAYGDISLDTKTGIDILSGDQIISYLAKTLPADEIIIGSDVDGVFTEDPKKNPSASLIPEIHSKNIEDVLNGLSGSQYIDVTGGMAQKVQELYHLTSSNTTIKIVNAFQKNRLKDAILGQDCIGTCFMYR